MSGPEVDAFAGTDEDQERRFAFGLGHAAIINLRARPPFGPCHDCVSASPFTMEIQLLSEIEP
jgi:hypothetical protein